MEAAHQAALLRPVNRTLSEDDWSVDQSSRDNNSPSDSAFHSDFSFISIQDLGNSLSGKTPIGWTDNRSSRPLTTATFRLLAFRQKPTFYSVREQTRKCRRRDLLSTNDAPGDDEYSPLANDDLSSDSEAYQGRCLQVPLSFDAARLPEPGHFNSAPSSSDVVKTRHAGATEADDVAGSRDVRKSASRDSCENLTPFGDDEDSVASEVLWSPSSHNAPPSRPEFVPQLDLSWVVEEEKAVGKQRSRKPKAIPSKPNERLDENSVQCKIDVKSQAPAINSRDIEKCCDGSLRTKESNYWREVNCGIRTNGVTSLSQQNDNHHHHHYHHLCSEDGAVEKELLHCPGDDRNFVEEPTIHRKINNTRVSETSSRHSTSSESLRDRAVQAFKTRSLVVHAADHRASQNQCSKSIVSAFPPWNTQKSSSLSVIDAPQKFLFNKTLWTKEIASTDEHSHSPRPDEVRNYLERDPLVGNNTGESADNSLTSTSCSCHEKAFGYVRRKPAILYYADENMSQNESAASCPSSRSHDPATGRRTSPEDSSTNANSPYETTFTHNFGHGNRFYDVEAAVERHDNKAKQLSFCNLTFYCLCSRTNCHCNYSCCRWDCTAEDQ